MTASNSQPRRLLQAIVFATIHAPACSSDRGICGNGGIRLMVSGTTWRPNKVTVARGLPDTLLVDTSGEAEGDDVVGAFGSSDARRVSGFRLRGEPPWHWSR